MQQLFSEFRPSTLSEWKNQLLKDLKGEAYESLLWHNENGIEIKPYFTGEDLKQNYEPAFTHTDWEITVEPSGENTGALNAFLLEKLNSGATAISIRVADHSLDELLKGIQLNYIRATFYVNGKNAETLKTYLLEHYEPEELHATLFPEAVKTLDELKDWDSVTDLFYSFPHISLGSFDATSYHNQNCFAYYEVAVMLAGMVETLEQLAGSGRLTNANFAIKTGVNSDYFMQIAKLRALRRLWKLVAAEYGIQKPLYLLVETSLTNKSISDNYNNLLRTTVEAMAAVSGGCNELIVSEFDVFLPVNKKLSGRMAVNQQLILKKESYLDTMADTACGSFYVESITDAIAARALEAFKEIEKLGGLMKCLENGLIQSTIEQQARQREEWVNSGKQVIIGVNKFKNEREKIAVPMAKLAELKELGIHNPVLNYELANFFNVTHA